MSTSSTQDPSAAPRVQAADAVLMVRPAGFGWNPETHRSNRFQRDDAALAGVASSRALAEFDALVAALREAGVEVCVAEDAPALRCPDAVFPNNWLSLHGDGTLVLYPMLAPNRRRERRPEVVRAVERLRGRPVRRVLDLTAHEREGRYLEGTGSVVFDHLARVAYAALSPRTHPVPLGELCDALGYRCRPFEALDATGLPVYHTNVVLALGTGFAVLADAAVAAGPRATLVAELRAGGREVFALDFAAMAGFAGNVLELRARDGARVLAMSAAAAGAFGAARLTALARHVDRIVAVPVPTIEALGGGSVRCMLAEVFL